MPTPRPNIGLFGGSFDPVHAGHLAIAAAARELAGLDKIIFLPARVSPHKTHAASEATAADRLAMLRLATARLPWAEVSDWELRQPPPSWTWRTVEHFQSSHPGARLHWLLGADQWQVIESWARAPFLRDNLVFLVFPRQPFPPPQPLPGWHMRVLPVEHPASATAIRESIAAGHTAGSDVSPAVAAYIARGRLYEGAPERL
jgi:nicotinate-nucleotide adenylyltransferase